MPTVPADLAVPLTDQAFRGHCERIYDAVIARLDREDPDEIEGEFSSGVIRIRLLGRLTFVLNHQAPLREVWYAAGDRAWHFRLDSGQKRWIDPRNGDELASTLSATISQVLGREISFVLPV